MVRLHLLGTIDLRDAQGREVRPVLAQPKRLALLAYLAAAEPFGPQRRDTLLGLFWPELDQDHARNALSQAVHFLRRWLGEESLCSRGNDELALDEAVVWTDVRAFHRALDEGRVEEAVGLYRGDLLPSFFVPDAGGFEEWLERERVRLRAQAAEAARLLAERHEAGGELTLAIRRAREAVELSNGDERPLRRLMELLARLGDRSAAIHAFDSFARRLSAEFDAEPSGETVALIETIRAARPVALGPIPTARPEGADAVPGTAATPVLPRVRARRLHLAGALAAAAILGAILATRGFRFAPAPTLDPNVVAIAPFEVLDPALGVWREGMVDILSRDLDGAGPLRTVSPTVAVRRWHGRADARAGQSLGRETGAGLVVLGQLLRSGGDSVRLRATLLDAQANRRLGEVALRGSVSRLDRVVETLTLELLREIGRDRPVGAVRQASISARPLPALKAFLRGEQFYRLAMWDSALAQYDHAIALDSEFALPYHRMQQVVGWGTPATNRYRDGEWYKQRAVLLNHGQTVKDSLLMAEGGFGGRLDPADPDYFTRYRQHLVVLRQATRLYPGDPEVWYELGEALFHAHSNEIASLAEPLHAFDRTLELDSAFGPAYIHTVWLALELGMPDRATKYAAAYLASTPAVSTGSSLALDAALLDPARGGSMEAARLLDTASDLQLWQGAWDLGYWPDSAETAVRLARAAAERSSRRFPGRFPIIADSLSRRTFLALLLAFRGHLEEAYRTAPPMVFRQPTVDNQPYFDLALLGVVPRDSAAAVFGRMLREDSLWPADGMQRRALPWWSAVRDTASLARFAERADSAALRHPHPVARAHLSFFADVARAYATLAKGDSAGALRALAALPDSLCMALVSDCYYEKLTQARLAAALGKDRTAADVFDRWILGRQLSAVGVLATLERGQVAERLGERDRALASYRFVVDVWRNADHRLRPAVAKARQALQRLEPGRP